MDEDIQQEKVEHASLDNLEATPHARPFEGGDPSVIRLALEADEHVEPHTHPERQIVLYLRSGRLEVELDGQSSTLETGDVVRFDGRREVSPRAIEDSEALIVLAKRAD